MPKSFLSGPYASNLALVCIYIQTCKVVQDIWWLLFLNPFSSSLTHKHLDAPSNSGKRNTFSLNLVGDVFFPSCTYTRIYFLCVEVRSAVSIYLWHFTCPLYVTEGASQKSKKYILEGAYLYLFLSVCYSFLSLSVFPFVFFLLIICEQKMSYSFILKRNRCLTLERCILSLSYIVIVDQK